MILLRKALTGTLLFSICTLSNAATQADMVKPTLQKDPTAQEFWQNQCQTAHPAASEIQVLKRANACLWFARVSTAKPASKRKLLSQLRAHLSEKVPTNSSEYGESLRLRGDLLMQEMGMRGLWFQFSNGARLLQLAKQAHQVNESNPHAKLLLAVVMANTPNFAGGDTEKADQWFSELMHDSDLEIRYFANFHICLANGTDEQICDYNSMQEVNIALSKGEFK